MALSADIISQFVKATNDRSRASTESTVYGTVQLKNGKPYVKLDGSDQLTPVSTTTNVQEGERVTVRIKDHVAIATGNITSPAARGKEVEEVNEKIGYFSQVTTQNLEAVNADIKNLRADYGEFEQVVTEDITAKNAVIESLIAKDVEIDGKLTADKADIDDLKADNAVIQDAVIKDLTAEDGSIKNLSAVYVNIDFTNIDQAWMDEFYARSGLIEDLVIGDGTVVRNLVGVTIKGDLIEGNTIVADKLVIQGDDGLYYKLNTQGVTANTYTDKYVKMGELVPPEGELNILNGKFTSDGEQVYAYTNTDGNTAYCTVVDDIFYEVLVETNALKVTQTDRNSLNGSIITAKSITAEQVNVSDLVAFDATIGGFHITSKEENTPGAIYSEVKDSENNVTRGIYFDTDAQVNIGDANNYIKYIKNDDGTYSLAISARDISYSLNGSQHSLSELGKIGEYVDIGTYEDEPCILLGESDSDFKLIITNTRIMFMEGSDLPAYISNKSLHIKKAVIEEELRLGCFVWQERANGNLGLTWQAAVTEVLV